MGTAFLDTSGWYAALSPKELKHRAALDAYRGWMEGGFRLVTTNLVVAEMQILLSRYRGAEEGLRFMSSLYQDPGHEVVFVDRELERAFSIVCPPRDPSTTPTRFERIVLLPASAFCSSDADMEYYRRSPPRALALASLSMSLLRCRTFLMTGSPISSPGSHSRTKYPEGPRGILAQLR